MRIHYLLKASLTIDFGATCVFEWMHPAKHRWIKDLQSWKYMYHRRTKTNLSVKHGSFLKKKWRFPLDCAWNISYFYLPSYWFIDNNVQNWFNTGIANVSMRVKRCTFSEWACTCFQSCVWKKKNTHLVVG